MEENIPPQKLEAARASLPIPAGIHVIAFIDTTLMGSGKTGLAITDNGVYLRNGQLTGFSKNYVSWEEFSSEVIWKAGRRKIEMGDDKHFYVSNGIFGINNIVQLLEEIQRYLTGEDEFDDDFDNLGEALLELELEFSIDDEDDEDEEEVGKSSNEWMIAVAGQQYGPYEPRLIREMVQIKQIRPETTLVWRPGMQDWVEFLKQPELAALAPRTVSPPPLPTAAPSVDPPSPPNVSVPSETLNMPADASVDAPVDFNQATEEQLQGLPGIGVVGAKRIIRERNANGGFQSAEQVGEWLGLKPHQVNQLKKHATFRATISKPSIGRRVDY